MEIKAVKIREERIYIIFLYDNGEFDISSFRKNMLTTDTIYNKVHRFESDNPIKLGLDKILFRCFCTNKSRIDYFKDKMKEEYVIWKLNN